MYAICFDMDTAMLVNTNHNESYNNAYNDIKKHLEKWGFNRQQGSVYFGNASVTPVSCVMAVMELSSEFAWFSASVRDVRMLRIEEQNDLKQAVDAGLRMTPNNGNP